MKNSTKLFATLLLYLSSIGLVLGQDTTVSGTVTDGSEGLPGVTVLVKGSTSGTVTDINGGFSIAAGQDDVLVFSFIGYTTQEVAVGGRTSFNVVMSEDALELAEVVVIGYGETTIRDATGAVAAVTSKDFNVGVISTPEQLIQGKTAGVQITGNSGAPGDGISLRIRGSSSVRSNNNPLFVVDGIPLAGDATSSAIPDVGFGTNADSNPLNFIDPNDIESISILKDASSAAIYGSRGANGVVFITTKKGQGEGQVNYRSSVSFSHQPKFYDLLDRDEYLSAIGQFGGTPSSQDFGFQTDWQDVITRDVAVSHKHSASYSKGFENGSIRGSLGYEDQEGIIENSGLDRITARLNGNYSMLDDRLDLSLQGTYSHVDLEYTPVSGSAGFRGDVIGSAYSANPTWPNDPDFDTGGQINPRNLLDNFRGTSVVDRVLLGTSAAYKITDDLTAKLVYGRDQSYGQTVALVSGQATNMGRGTTGNGRGGAGFIGVENNLMEATLNYKKELGSIELDVVGGYSYQDFGRKVQIAEGFGFRQTASFDGMQSDLLDTYDAVKGIAQRNANGFIGNFGYGSNLNGTPGDETGFVSYIEGDEFNQSFFNVPNGETSIGTLAVNRFNTTDMLQSYFGRANVTIMDKYILTATLRADGSSRFGDDNKVGVFPSGAFAWKLSEESFVPDVFTDLKLRAGYGIVGNQDGLGYGNFVRRSAWNGISIGDAGDIVVPGTTVVGFARPDLQWEETSQLSIGVDFALFDDRVVGAFDYYNKETSDLLLQLNVAQPAPNPTQFRNFDASVVNEGWELYLKGDVVRQTDFDLSVSFNISKNDNEIKDFGGLVPAGTIRGQGLTGAFSQALAAGQPLFAYYVREFEGFDANGQPIGDVQTFVDKGALPVWNGGLNVNARYKNWDAGVYFAGQAGHYVYNNTQNAFFTAGSIANARNVTKDVLTSGESPAAAADVSTRFLEKGDFIRFQNLNIGYNFELPDGFIKALRIYGSAQNLALWTDYSGLDPEVSTAPGQTDLLNGLPAAGIDYTAYPRARTYTIGVNATF